MSTLDWGIILVSILLLSMISIYISRHTKKTQEYLVADRSAGRFLLASATIMGTLGAINIINKFQVGFEAGFTYLWWNMLIIPLGIIVALTGWIAYRWRMTRIMTQAEIFEKRYGKNYRILGGLILFIGGVASIGIVPGVAARFFKSYFFLPDQIIILGMSVPTIAFFVVLLVSMAFLFSFWGGQKSLIVTDSIQAVLTMVVLLLIFVYFMLSSDWGEIFDSLSNSPPGESKIDPYDVSGGKDYDAFFFFIMAVKAVFIIPAEVKRQASNSCGVTPHETRMAHILAKLKAIFIFYPLILIPTIVCAISLSPEYQHIWHSVTASISVESVQTQRELMVPMTLAEILPKGLIGAFGAVMLISFLTTNNSLFFIYGSTLVQDVILPKTKKKLSQKAHLTLLRCSIVLVSVITVLISLFYEQSMDVVMYFSLVYSFIGGAVTIPFIASLYWKGATRSGAWVSAVLGIVLSIIAFAISHDIAMVKDKWRLHGDSVSWTQHTVYFRNKEYVMPAGKSSSSILVWDKSIKKYVGFENQAVLDTNKNFSVIAIKKNGDYQFMPSARWDRFCEQIAKIPGVLTMSGAEKGFYILLICLFAFVTVSMASRRIFKIQEFNLDVLLNRGAYAIEEDKIEKDKPRMGTFNRILNITHSFSTRDKLIYYFVLSWGAIWLSIFLGYSLLRYLSIDIGMSFVTFWQWNLWINFVLVIGISVVFLVGTCKELIGAYLSKQRKKTSFIRSPVMGVSES